MQELIRGSISTVRYQPLICIFPAEYAEDVMNILKITREQFQVLEESVRMLFKKLGQAANLLTDARLTALIGGLAIAWISSPTAAGLLAYLVALATQGYFK